MPLHGRVFLINDVDHLNKENKLITDFPEPPRYQYGSSTIANAIMEIFLNLEY